MEWNNRILVIDDQENIHEDFEKVLGRYHQRGDEVDPLADAPEPRARGRAPVLLDMETYEDLILGPDRGGDLVHEARAARNFDERRTEAIPIDGEAFLAGNALYQIDHATSGEKGLARFEAASDSPYAVVFVDVRMPPGIDGIEVAKKILDIDSDTEIVVVSAYSDYSWADMLTRLARGDRFHFLAKPFNHLSLKQMAYNCTVKWNKRRFFHMRDEEVARERDFLHKVLEHAGTVFLVEDFSAVFARFKVLRAEGVTDLSAYLEGDKQAVASFAEMVTIDEVRMRKHPDLEFDIEPGTRLSELLYPESLPIFKQQLCSLWAGEKQFEGTLKKKNKQGEPTTLRLLMMVSDRDLNEGRVTVSLTAQPPEQEDYLTDPLTRLPNRELFDIHLDQTFKEYGRRKHTGDARDNRFALLFVDLNDFKRINDDYNHQVGDMLLRELAVRLQRHRRDVDIVSRRGGDEFTLLLRGLRAYDAVDAILESIRTELARPMNSEDYHGPLSASIGCAVCPEDTEDQTELIRFADQAMYRAKRNGNGIFRAVKWRDHRHEARTLETAVVEDQLRIRYQPFLDGDSLVWAGQAIPVLEHPERGDLTTERLLDLALLTGRLEGVCHWIFDSVVETIAGLKREGLPMSMFLDLGETLLQKPGLLDHLRHRLEARAIDPSALVLQIPEKSLSRMTDMSAFFTKAKARGFRICLGDHDPGQGPWAIYRYPFDAVAIRAPRIEAVRRKQDQDLYLGVLALITKNNPDLSLIITDVTNASQHALLEAHGFQAAQGSHLDEPLAPKAYHALLVDRTHRRTASPVS